MRRLPVILLTFALLGIGGAAAWAATVNGTSKNDTLRGTAKADKIYGKAGNDKLYGLGGNDYLNGGPGNDTLTGGPGADRYVCGPGRDTVVGDSKDVAAKDCEVVTGLKTTPPPSPPPAPEPTTTTTSTTPAPTPSVNVLQGRYCGFTNQGQSICFTVDPSGRSFSSAHFGATPACRPPEPSWIFTLDFPSHVTINADGSFVYDVNVGDLTGSFVHGSIDGAGSASGTMHMTPQSFDKAGYGHYDCDSVDTTWQAKLQQ